MAESCGECRFWIPDNSHHAHCRRYPPTPGDGYPFSRADSWCGEFRLRAADPPPGSWAHESTLKETVQHEALKGDISFSENVLPEPGWKAVQVKYGFFTDGGTRVYAWTVQRAGLNMRVHVRCEGPEHHAMDAEDVAHVLANALNCDLSFSKDVIEEPSSPPYSATSATGPIG